MDGEARQLNQEPSGLLINGQLQLVRYDGLAGETLQLRA
jgi:hypothetical protein